MTQFAPPPYPPPAYAARPGPPPWSAAAIAAFVLSLLGFLGVTAVLGVIFGIIGCVRTSGGRRRGMGLAIASIPISLVTGAVSVLVLVTFLFAARMAKVPEKLRGVLGSTDVTRAADDLRKLSSDDWNQAVSDDALRTWLGTVQKKYGALTSVAVDMPQTMTASRDGTPAAVLNGRFVNASAAIHLKFDPQNLLEARLSDIEIDGSSPRAKPTDDQSITPP